MERRGIPDPFFPNSVLITALSRVYVDQTLVSDQSSHEILFYVSQRGKARGPRAPKLKAKQGRWKLRLSHRQLKLRFDIPPPSPF